MFLCSFCGKDCKNPGGLGAHRPYCKSNPDKIPYKAHGKSTGKGRTPWNKGLTLKNQLESGRISQDDFDRLILASKKGGTNSTGKGATEEKELLRKQRITEKARLNNGGYRLGSGRGKKGWYKGFFCDSSYELAYVIYNLDNNIKIERNTEIRTYEWEGRTRQYIPDFICDGVLVEIKGFKTEQWLAKLSHNTDVTVLYEEDLQNVFDYVINKYGKDFISLYEEKS